MKRLLELVLALLFQGYQGLICKVAWPAYQYFFSLLKSNFHLAHSFSIFLLGDNICMLDFQDPSSEGKEEVEGEEEIPSLHHAVSSSSSFIETYPHFWHGNMK